VLLVKKLCSDDISGFSHLAVSDDCDQVLGTSIRGLSSDIALRNRGSICFQRVVYKAASQRCGWPQSSQGRDCRKYPESRSGNSPHHDDLLSPGRSSGTNVCPRGTDSPRPV
jgi:hypothetical protein